MFERFTDRARRVVVLAQEEARGFNHNYIGTEHLLLGLLAEGEGIAAQTLASLGVTSDRTRLDIDERIGYGSEAPKGHIPFTPRAKKVLELSLRESLKHKHGYIGTEHVLLGLVREGEGVAAQILMTRVVGGLEAVERQVFDVLGMSGAIEEARERSSRWQRPSLGQLHISGERELIVRLEAIEARLSAIERLLREDRGEQTG